MGITYLSAINALSSLEALHDVARAIWQDRAAGRLSEADAEAAQSAIETRRRGLQSLRDSNPPRPLLVPVRRPQSPRSPNRAASLSRRRRWAASGALPPELAAELTLGELAVLSVVGRKATQGRSFAWPLDRLAAVAGVCRTTAKSALKIGQRLGLVRITERRQTANRNLPNLVRITAASWWRWLRRGGGVRNLTGTSTKVSKKAAQDRSEASSGPARAALGPYCAVVPPG